MGDETWRRVNDLISAIFLLTKGFHPPLYFGDHISLYANLEAIIDQRGLYEQDDESVH